MPAKVRLSNLPFIKMHGLGNDFIVIDGLKASALSAQKKLLTPENARKLCDRRFGIGADQILWIKPAQSKKAVAEMEVINADGSPAEMCGNGIRAVALYLDGLVAPAKRKNSYLIDTGAGPLNVEILPGNKAAERLARVGMGIPKISKMDKLELGSRKIDYLAVNMGNPHAIIFVDNAWEYPVEELGPQIEKHSNFPNRTNVEFVHAEDQATLVVRVWERGAGLTLACGTGACAAAVAAIVRGKCQSPVEVKLPGGSLRIEWAGKGEPVLMSGPAEEAFRGEISL